MSHFLDYSHGDLRWEMLLAWVEVVAIWVMVLMELLQGLVRNPGLCPGPKHMASNVRGSVKSHV